MTTHQAIQAEQHNVEPLDPRQPNAYAAPKLEKMQKLAQVTGIPVLTGPVG